MTTIDTVEALETVNGATPPQMHLKVIDHLDTGALRWIGCSPLAIICSGGPATVEIALAGGEPGFADGTREALRIPLAAFDQREAVAVGRRFGSLFLIPGIGETLRVNGHVASIEDEVACIAVEEVYGHCAKALIRSEFWAAPGNVPAPHDRADFVAASRFLALATTSAGGAADVSPKGDPAGCMARLDDGALWFADRPGNRRVDSFRNILERSDVAIALFVPGSTMVAIARGRAVLTTDDAARERFEVKGKVPKLVTCVKTDAFELYESGALIRAQIWPARPSPDIDPAKLFLDHVRLNRDGGVGAAISRSILNLPGATNLVRKGLAKDYRDRLY